MPFVKLDLMIEAIHDLRVQEHVPDGAIACMMTVLADDGEKLKLGLSRGALETLCNALIANSPRSPGTPGRN
jgi:hypothetical protein